MGLPKSELVRDDISFKVFFSALLKMKTDLSRKRLLFGQVDASEFEILVGFGEPFLNYVGISHK